MNEKQRNPLSLKTWSKIVTSITDWLLRVSTLVGVATITIHIGVKEGASWAIFIGIAIWSLAVLETVFKAFLALEWFDPIWMRSFSGTKVRLVQATLGLLTIVCINWVLLVLRELLLLYFTSLGL